MQFGMIISATAIGSFLGAALNWFKGKVREAFLLRISLLSLGVSILLVSITSTLWPALALFGAIGVTQVIVSITIDTLMQKHVENEILGRTFATMGMIVGVCQLISMGGGGLLADILGIRTVYIIGGIIIMTTSVLAASSIRLPVPAEETGT